MKTSTKQYFKTIFGIVIVTFSLFIIITIKPKTEVLHYLKCQKVIIPSFIAIWFAISILFKKYKLGDKSDLRRIIPAIIRTNIIIGGITTTLMFGLRSLDISRFVLFGTLILGTILETTYFILIKQVIHSKKIDHDNIVNKYLFTKNATDNKLVTNLELKTSRQDEAKPPTDIVLNYIKTDYGEDICNFLTSYLPANCYAYTILSTTTLFNIKKLQDDNYECIINLKRVNDIQFINKFFSNINKKLKPSGLFIGRVETKKIRKKRLLNKYPPLLNYIYYTFDFIFKRLFPKFNITKKLYFFLTRGENRVISKAEVLGRLYSCGFKVTDTKEINKLMFFTAVKERAPYKDPNPTYGPIIKLLRVGKDKKLFYVYKIRTMHPFAEYLQSYIYDNYKLKKGGKFENDFRITTMGRIMRKFWIDELPMIINIFKGELKIVGVRPLSQHYFNLYSAELQELRTKYKPGLIPPFYVDMPKTLDEIQKSEMKYLKQYQKHPFTTDIKYFFKAFYNILFKKARSE